jgi:hypothetical protein
MERENSMVGTPLFSQAYREKWAARPASDGKSETARRLILTGWRSHPAGTRRKPARSPVSVRNVERDTSGRSRALNGRRSKDEETTERMLDTEGADGPGDCLRTERVRRVAQCSIPGAARKNERRCSWVNSLP